MPTKEKENKHTEASNAMKTPPVVSPQEWEAAHQQMLVKEKAFTRSRDALAAVETEAGEDGRFGRTISRT